MKTTQRFSSGCTRIAFRETSRDAVISGTRSILRMLLYSDRSCTGVRSGSRFIARTEVLAENWTLT
jgi:hypothetical protein